MDYNTPITECDDVIGILLPKQNNMINENDQLIVNSKFKAEYLRVKLSDEIVSFPVTIEQEFPSC